MDAERRARLLEKRRLAQLRRQRAGASATFRRIGRLLCERGVPFSKLVPARCREALGPLTGGPGEDERLLWAPILNGACSAWTSGVQRDALLRAALARCVPGDGKVAIVWSPFEAGLKIRAGDLARFAPAVFDELHGTVWIVAAAGGPWLIELSYWDCELCWTRSMPLFASTA